MIASRWIAHGLATDRTVFVLKYFNFPKRALRQRFASRFSLPWDTTCVSAGLPHEFSVAGLLGRCYEPIKVRSRGFLLVHRTNTEKKSKKHANEENRGDHQ